MNYEIISILIVVNIIITIVLAYSINNKSNTTQIPYDLLFSHLDEIIDNYKNSEFKTQINILKKKNNVDGKSVTYSDIYINELNKLYKVSITNIIKNHISKRFMEQLSLYITSHALISLIIARLKAK